MRDSTYEKLKKHGRSNDRDPKIYAGLTEPQLWTLATIVEGFPTVSGLFRLDGRSCRVLIREELIFPSTGDATTKGRRVYREVFK